MPDGVSISLAAAALILILAHGIGFVLLHPLRKRNSQFPGNTQFQVLDYYTLLVEQALATFLIAWPLLHQAEHPRLSVGALLVLALLAFWWFIGIRLLSRGKVTDTFKRTVALGVLVPTAFGGTLILLTAFTTSVLFGRDPEGYVFLGLKREVFAAFWWRPLWLFLLLPYGQLFLMLLVLLCCPRIARWVVQGQQEPDS